MTDEVQKFDLIIIGSGIAGTHAALIASQFGLKVAVVEEHLLGGDSLHYSDLPLNYLFEAAKSYHQTLQPSTMGIHTCLSSFNYPQILRSIERIINKASLANHDFYKKHQITLIRGRAYFLSPNKISVDSQHFQAPRFLIATGASWQTPTIPGLSEVSFYTPRNLFRMATLPKTLFIIGGHPVAVNLAQILAIFGVKVYLTCSTETILPDFDPEISRAIERTLSEEFGVVISTNSRVLEISQNYVSKKILFSHAGIERELIVNELLIAHHLAPEIDLGLHNASVEFTQDDIMTNQFLQTTNRQIFAAGDVLNMKNTATSATIEAETAVLNLVKNQHQAISYGSLPEIVMMTPLAAKVGLTETDCQSKNLKYQVLQANFNEAPRQALSQLHNNGVLKLVVKSDGQILGAQVYGPEAESIIQQLALAIEYRITVKQLINLPQSFLSWQEVINIVINRFKHKTAK